MITFTRLSEFAEPCGIPLGQSGDADLHHALRTAEQAVLRAIGMLAPGPSHDVAGDPVYNLTYNTPAAGYHPYLIRWVGGYPAATTQPDEEDLLPGATYIEAPTDLATAAAGLACRIQKGKCGGGPQSDFSVRRGISDAALQEAKGVIPREYFRRVPMGISGHVGWLAPTWPLVEARVFLRDPNFERYFYDPDQDPDAAIAEADYTGTNALLEQEAITVDLDRGLVTFQHPVPYARRA